MRVIINSAHQRFGGGVQVALSFIHECRKYPEHEYHVFLGPGLVNSINQDKFSNNFHFYYFNFGVVNLLKTIRINNTLRSVERKIQPDCIIATTGPTYFNSKAPQIIGFNLPLYIYPESPYIKNLLFYRKVRLFLKKKFHFYFFKRDAVAFLAQTDDVNQRIKKELGTEQVYTVTNTHSAYYREWVEYPQKLPPRDPSRIRLLTISSWYLHKNLEIIPEVLQVLNQRGHTNIEFITTVKNADLRHITNGKRYTNIINVGPVKPEECPSLYHECDIMFLPTLAECFSASYPEAMIMEKPIVTSDLGFARSICGDAALYYSPKDPVAAAKTVEKLIKDKTLGLQLIKNGKQRLQLFDTPEIRAKKYLEICKKFMKAKEMDI